MSKSIFEVIANYYNIELNKPFKIRYKRNGQEYDVCFKKESIDLLNPISNKWVASFTPLEAILEEYVDIILPPFIPVLGDTYWFVAIDQPTNTLAVDCNVWVNDLMDFQLLKSKNVFRTKEDAEKRLSCVMDDLLKVKEEYEANKRCKEAVMGDYK